MWAFLKTNREENQANLKVFSFPRLEERKTKTLQLSKREQQMLAMGRPDVYS